LFVKASLLSSGLSVDSLLFFDVILLCINHSNVVIPTTIMATIPLSAHNGSVHSGSNGRATLSAYHASPSSNQSLSNDHQRPRAITSTSLATSPVASPLSGFSTSPLPSPNNNSHMVTISSTSPVSINDVRTQQHQQQQYNGELRSSPSASPTGTPPIASIASYHQHHHLHPTHQPPFHSQSQSHGSSRPGSGSNNNSRSGSPAAPSGVWLPSTTDNIFDPSNYQIHRNNTRTPSGSTSHAHSLSAGSVERPRDLSHLLATSSSSGWGYEEKLGRHQKKKADDDDDAFFISESPDPQTRRIVMAPKSEPRRPSPPNQTSLTPLSRSRAGSGQDPHLPPGHHTSSAAAAALAMLAGVSGHMNGSSGSGSGSISPSPSINSLTFRFGGTGGLVIPQVATTSLHVPMPIKPWYKQSHVPIIHRQGLNTPPLYFRVIREPDSRVLFKMRLPAEEDVVYERLSARSAAAASATTSSPSIDIARTGTPPPPSTVVTATTSTPIHSPPGGISITPIHSAGHPHHITPGSHASLLALPTTPNVPSNTGGSSSNGGSGGWPSARTRSRNPSMDRAMLIDDAGAAAVAAAAANRGHSRSNSVSSEFTAAAPTPTVTPLSVAGGGIVSPSSSMNNVASLASSSIDDDFDTATAGWLCCRKKSKEHKFRFRYQSTIAFGFPPSKFPRPHEIMNAEPF
jgi:hypothetical protein